MWTSRRTVGDVPKGRLLFRSVSSLACSPFPCSDPALGHSGAGAVQKEHGAALLQERARRGLRVRHDQRGEFPQPAVLDRRMQTTLASQ